jgi:hypothetical protein
MFKTNFAVTHSTPNAVVSSWVTSAESLTFFQSHAPGRQAIGRASATGIV